MSSVVTGVPSVRARFRSAAAAAGAVLGAATVLLLTAGPAAAHSVLLSTNPGESARTGSSPSEVVLTFNEMPRQRFSTIHVIGPDGARRDSGTVSVVDDTARQQLGGTRPAGTYTVDWRVISSDGHPVSGQYTYTATAAAATLAAAPATDEPAAKSGAGFNWGVFAAIAAPVIVLGGGLARYVRRRRLHAGPPRRLEPADD